MVTEPESRSAWVTVYDAVHVIDALGARLAVAGQASSVALSSLTVNGPDNVDVAGVRHRVAVARSRDRPPSRWSASPS